MKKTLLISCLMIGTQISLFAQSDEIENNNQLSISTEGFKLTTKSKSKISFSYLGVDLGLNMLVDPTNYNQNSTQQFINAPDNLKNKDLFALRQGKSINVNIWPINVNYKFHQGRNQRISLYSGVGMQLYNFRYSKPITLQSTPQNQYEYDEDFKFSKNKLALAYASMPLMLNFQTRLDDKFWLVYGFGVIGGICFDSWTKQVSDEFGKQKNHDPFNIEKLNLNLAAEIGIKNFIRFYATYQVTNLYKNGLEHYPLSIGIRFSTL